MRKPVAQTLSRVGGVQLGEGVVLLDEAEPTLSHLAAQPFVTVDVGLDGKGEPRLQTYIDQAELGIEEVIVDHALQTPGEDQAWPVLSLDQLDAPARLHATENSDQSFAEASFADLFLDERLL